MWTKELEENTRADDSFLGGIAVGEIRGEAQGIEKGIEIERTNMIARMNARNIQVEVISDIVEMPVTKVLEIIKTSKTIY